MGMRNLAVLVAAMAMSAFWLSSGASAFCGTVQAAATGPSEGQALSKANNIGLKETNDLDRKYGNKVKYQQAKSHCQLTNSGAVSCKITQQFCVNGSKPKSNQVNPNSSKCKIWADKCKNGNNKSCANYESECQND